MAKVRATSSEEVLDNQKPRRTRVVTRTRTAKSTDTESSSRPRRTRSGTSRVTSEVTASKTDTAVTRRAPTSLPHTTSSSKKKPVFLIASLIILSLSIGVSAFIGSTDPGQINVAAISQERRERIERGELPPDTSVTSAVDARPNAGLTPSATAAEDALRPSQNPDSSSVDVPTLVDVQTEQSTSSSETDVDNPDIENQAIQNEMTTRESNIPQETSN